jgi:hydroxyacylglutathione hydrolase
VMLELVKSEGLAHNSYFLADGEEALVVDPRRDCMIYAQLAEQECAKIIYILETHRNEDYVVGSIELQNTTDAEIAHGKDLPFKYGEHSLGDGDALNIGRLKVKALSTPGHTNESLCYVVYGSDKFKDPMMVFTGDTLFAGEVGRTDLYGPDAHKEQAEKLYYSIHRKLLPLGDHVIVCPGHGAGSVCGHNISDREYSTLGYERKTNPMLQLDNEAFVSRSIAQEMLVPPYFRRMEHYNLNGAPLLRDVPVPRVLSVSEFEKEIGKSDTVVVDTREPDAFAGSFIPGSLSIWLDGLSIFPGWVLNYEQRILLVTERKEDVETAKAYLWRIGFHNITGYLCQGIGGWRNAGKPIEHLDTLSAATLKKRLDRNEVVLLDVREPSEWAEGYVNGARRIFVGHLATEAGGLPQDKPIAVFCSVGHRGSLGASLLKRSGFRQVYNVLGGAEAWENSGYPLTKVHT